VRKVTPSQLHGPLRIKDRAPQAPSRGQATPIRPHMPANGFTPLTDHPLTRAELRQRAKAARQARRSGQPQPAGRQDGDGMEYLRGQWQGYHASTYGGQEGRRQRQPDAMQQATETMRRVHQQQPGRPGQQVPRRDIAPSPLLHQPSPPRAQQQPQARDDVRRPTLRPVPDAAARNGQPQPPTRAERVSREAARASRDDQNQNTPPERAGRAPEAAVPPLPGHPESVRKAAEDHEKGRWAGLRKRTADAPERTRTSRSRTRTTA
jgi:hypothetical protein